MLPELLNWMLLIVSAVGAAYVLTHAGRLAAKPRRGREWRPSRRAYLLLGAVLVVVAVGFLFTLAVFYGFGQSARVFDDLGLGS